jgi:hypothetical protein
MLKAIVSILRESPLYKTFSAEEKRAIIKTLADSYSFTEDGKGGDILGNESRWAEIIQTNK